MNVTAVQDRIGRICAGTLDSRDLRHRVLAEIRSVVPFSWYAWLLTDPETSVGAAPLAQVPPSLISRLPTMIRLKYLTKVNRWTALDSSPAFLHRATSGELDRSLLWRDLLRDYSVVDIASLVFRDRFGCWGFLDLWRDAGSPPFDTVEASVLAGAIEPITNGLRRSQAATFAAPPDESGPSVVPDSPAVAGPVVLLLSPELEVLDRTAHTSEYLRLLVPPDEGRAPIPAGAYNVAAQLLAVEAGVDTNVPTARVHLLNGRWLSLRAARLADGAQANIAVTFEDATATQRLSLFARCCGLSPRETELLGLLPSGRSTRELAARLYVSEHTVQDHLKSIFAKTGVRTRPALLSRALGA